jgi:hypothetical protein
MNTAGHYLHEDAIAQQLKSRFPDLPGGMIRAC